VPDVLPPVDLPTSTEGRHAMSRIITAWAVVNETTGLVYETAVRQVTAEALAGDVGFMALTLGVLA